MNIAERTCYTAGIHIYAGGVAIASLRNRKARLMHRGHKEVWAKLKREITSGRKYIWVHAASLGEFEQGRPLIERFRKNFPDYGIILTFFSPSGYEVRKNYEGADIVCYLPFDTTGNAHKFVKMVNPAIAIFVKYEIWGNYLEELKKRGIPTYLVSAIMRQGQIFFRKYGGITRKWLRCFDRIFVQDQASVKLLEKAGITDVEAAGDTRFDRVADIRDARKEIPALSRFKKEGDILMMAGSSWPADEDIYLQWVNSHPEIKLVIAPHEFDASRLKNLKARLDNGAILLSEITEDTDLSKFQCIIIDCFGLLSSAYSYADMAYVGGAFGAGLHNVNEAAVYGIPVIFGLRYEKFLEARDLVTLGGAISVADRREFEKTADKLLYDNAERTKRGRWAGEYIKEKLGASDKIFEYIKKKL